MKKLLSLLLLLSAVIPPVSLSAGDSQRQAYTIYVDSHGVMRRSDTDDEVTFYGTNYTLPFAHAYRAMDYVKADRKQVIDLDVNQMKRLGFNAFRLHLWDAELADADGNLLANDHLDLLDYLLARLEDAGIDIILTAQTNFGNGYPERNIDTGAFTYDFDKCDIHANPAAQAIQERYLRQLVEHLNPYTGMTYASDRAIIGIEINNEPCHTAPARDVTRYIDRMARSLRRGGFDRIILYNVSHNPDVTAAYYDADIQATTYQWYPDGLVAGHQRQGNLLPYVDAYPIPWSGSVRNYDRMARVVYEFDPGDVLCTYLYPAVTRTFRSQGFGWVTQFAYDPTPIARYNTEYQTHFLNLLYTPGKALGMMIAAQAMQRIPAGADYGIFPADTVFSAAGARFEVSYPRDLAIMTSDTIYIHTNHTDIEPEDFSSLRHIAGCGSSPLVTYPGTGAYFLDRIADTGAWRLELMPDVAVFADPFARTSLRRPVASLYYAPHNMTLNLPDLPDDYIVTQIADADGPVAENNAIHASDATVALAPGVFIIAADEEGVSAALGAGTPARYCAPRALSGAETRPIPSVEHHPDAYIDTGAPLTLTARVLAEEMPRRVTVYPSDISFWRDNNTLYEMTTRDGVNYTVTIPAEALHDGFTYNIVVEDSSALSFTYPARTSGTPLDWDVITTQYYTSAAARPDAPVNLYIPHPQDTGLDVAMIPEEYTYRWRVVDNAPDGAPTLQLDATPRQATRIVVRQYVGDITSSPALSLSDRTTLELLTSSPLPEGTTLSVTTTGGLTYSAPAAHTLLLSEMTLAPTPIIPAPYPTFLPREFNPSPGTLPAHPDPADIEMVQLTLPVSADTPVSLSLSGIRLR